MEQLKKLLNLKILFGTISNIILILVILGVIGQTQADTGAKVAELICSILVQVGILTTKDV